MKVERFFLVIMVGTLDPPKDGILGVYADTSERRRSLKSGPVRETLAAWLHDECALCHALFDTGVAVEPPGFGIWATVGELEVDDTGEVYGRCAKPWRQLSPHELEIVAMGATPPDALMYFDHPDRWRKLQDERERAHTDLERQLKHELSPATPRVAVAGVAAAVVVVAVIAAIVLMSGAW